MAEIRANREYKFKEFSISEEIPKSPPIKTKRWMFHDARPNNRFYIRPPQRKWDEHDSPQVTCSGDTNVNQQYVKPFKKPESDLRAEFFNAYKKYYRRVDIKRLEVESTLNVDAKFKGADESVEGESSLYKEKECMEINIVMDTEADDALVSSQVRRTVMCAAPGGEAVPGEGGIRACRTVGGVREDLESNNQDVASGERFDNDSGYLTSPNGSSCHATDLSVRPGQKHLNLENQHKMAPTLNQERSSMNHNLSPVHETSQSLNNNIESKSEKNALQHIGKVPIFNPEAFNIDPCNDTLKKRDLLENEPIRNWSFPVNQAGVGNVPSVTGVDQVTQKEEKNGYINRLERTCFNSKIKSNIEDPVHPTPFEFRNPDEKQPKSEGFQNRKRVGSELIDFEDVTRSSALCEDTFVSSECDNVKSRTNPFVGSFEILQNAEKSIHIDINKSQILDQYSPEPDPYEFQNLPDPHIKCNTMLIPNDYNFEEEATKGQYKKNNDSFSDFRTQSAKEPFSSKCYEEASDQVVQSSEEEFSNSESSIRFRGLRGASLNESNKKILKSLVVNVIKSDPNYRRNVTKHDFNQIEDTNVTHHYKNNGEFPNLEKINVFTGSQKPLITKTSRAFNPSPQFSYQDPVCPRYKKLEVPQTIQNVNRRSGSTNDFKNICSEKKSLTITRKEHVEEPFVIWANKNNKDLTESIQINKLTVSDKDLKLGIDYDIHSNLQSSSDCHNVAETSDGVKNLVNRQDHQVHTQSSENRMETHLKVVPKSTNQTKEQESGEDGRANQFPEKRYSHTTSVARKNCALPKFRSFNASSSVLDSRYVNEERESGRTTCPQGEIGNLVEKKSEDVHHNLEFFDERECKQRSKENIKERQLTERTARTCQIKTIGGESNGIKNAQEGYVAKQAFSKQVSNAYNVYESNNYDKKNSKSSSSDFLQIGPTQSVNYSPPHNNESTTKQQEYYDRKWQEREIDDRCCNVAKANAFHCSHEGTKHFIHKKKIEIPFETGCNHSSPLHCNNYLNTRPHEMICNAHYRPKPNDINSRGWCSPANDNYCDCEDPTRGSSHRMVKYNNVCSCRVRDTRSNRRGRNHYECPKCMNHQGRVGCPCQVGNRKYCQECDDEEMMVVFEECTGNFHRPNNLPCYHHGCSTETRLSGASTRKRTCCCDACGEKRMDSSPFRFDRESQWMSTGHQPKRNHSKCPAGAYIERSEEPSCGCVVASDDYFRKSRNNCSMDSSCNENPHSAQEAADCRRRNNSYWYDKEVENIYQIEPTVNDSVRNHSLNDFKLEEKHYSVDSEEANLNVPGRVDSWVMKDESKGHAARGIPEKKVYSFQENKILSNEGGQFCMTDRSNSNDRNAKGTDIPLKTSDRTINEPLFLCEEQWDTEDGLSMRRFIRKREESKQEEQDSSYSEDEPIYLREEHWETDGEEIGASNSHPRGIRSTCVRYPNDINCRWKEQRSGDNRPGGRGDNFSEGEESRKCSSVHAVSDPSFHCEEQWASDEEKCEDHRMHSTLPKNRMRKKKGQGRRSFNPRRWDMVTDLPKNEFLSKQNRNHNDFGMGTGFSNRKYCSNDYMEPRAGNCSDYLIAKTVGC